MRRVTDTDVACAFIVGAMLATVVILSFLKLTGGI